MIDSELRDDLLDRLRATPAHLRGLINGVDAAALRRAGPDGGWGAVEILCHLRDWDEIYTERVERLLDEDEPTIAAVDDTLWPIEREYFRQDPHKVLDEFAAGRTRLVEILNTLKSGEWLRGGHHPYYGRQTIAWYAEHCATHDQEHVEQLQALLQRRPHVRCIQCLSAQPVGSSGPTAMLTSTAAPRTTHDAQIA